MADNNPMFDFGQMLSQMNIPGVDVEGMMESSRKDWEALQNASELSAAGWQKLAQRQQELTQEALSQMQTEFTQNMSQSPQENAEKMRANVEQAMANMSELAEIIRQSQGEAAAILQERFEANMARMMPGAQSVAATAQTQPEEPAAKAKAPAKKRAPRKST